MRTQPSEKLVVSIGAGDGGWNQAQPCMAEFSGDEAADFVHRALVQRGFVVTELKLRTAFFVKRDTGELMLSREVDQIAREHDARIVVAGT